MPTYSIICGGLIKVIELHRYCLKILGKCFFYFGTDYFVGINLIQKKLLILNHFNDHLKSCSVEGMFSYN